MPDRVETDVVGQDGHIYKARISPTQMDHLPTLAQPKVSSKTAVLTRNIGRDSLVN